jgi:hypothetical protein
MTDLIRTIENLKNRDWFDYFSAFSPLLLSCIAIIIALYTSRKQNAISIFEKRYSNYSDLLDFFSVWKIFVDHFYRICEQNKENFADEICKLCLSVSLLGHDETNDIDVSEFIIDKKFDGDRVRDMLLNLHCKDTKTLEMASLINGRYSRKIDDFRRKYILFFDNLGKTTLGIFSKEELYKEVNDFQESLEMIYKLVFKKIKPKVKVID